MAISPIDNGEPGVTIRVALNEVIDYVNTISGSSIFPYTGSAIISGSLEVIGNANISNLTGNLTGSLIGTASWASNALTASYTNGALSASYALTASYLENAPDPIFVKNRTTQTTSSILEYQSIFNPSDLLIQPSNIFIVEQNAEYYVLGDLINSGTLQVDGTLKVGGSLINLGAITGIGIIL